MSATAKVRRPGSGRTKGSYSFITVTLGELNAKFNDPTQQIVIGRKFAEGVGFKATAVKATDIAGRIEGQTPETRVPMKIVDLDAE